MFLPPETSGWSNPSSSSERQFQWQNSCQINPLVHLDFTSRLPQQKQKQTDLSIQMFRRLGPDCHVISVISVHFLKALISVSHFTSFGFRVWRGRLCWKESKLMPREVNMQSSTGRITPLLITKRFVLGTSSPGQQDTFNTARLSCLCFLETELR